MRSRGKYRHLDLINSSLEGLNHIGGNHVYKKSNEWEKRLFRFIVIG